MNFPVWKLYHCSRYSDYAKTVFIDLKIKLSGLIVEMFNVLGEDYCYELFVQENPLLVTCREHLIKSFAFGPLRCLHYCKRRHFVFHNTIGCKTHPKCCKIIKCCVCYRRSLLETKRAFPYFMI